MEDMMRPHSCAPISVSPKLAMHKDSHTISKFKPKIRIIHIFAPDIITTDAANFRELVQRLTGKPTDRNGSRKKTKKLPSNSLRTCFIHESNMTMQVQDGLPSLINGEKIKEEENEIWRGDNLNGFFDGFVDFDGLIHELSDFPEVSLQSSYTDASQ